ALPGDRGGAQPGRARALPAGQRDARRADLGRDRVRGGPRDPRRQRVHRLPAGRPGSAAGDGEAGAPLLRHRGGGGRRGRGVGAGGGWDVNVLLRGGLPSVNLCNGLLDIHTPDERIAVTSLERLVDLTLALIATARNGH